MPKKSKFDSRTYYIGTEDDDILFLRKFIVKHTNAKSKHLSNIHELPRLEKIVAKLKNSDTTEADMSKQNEELRKIVEEMDDKFLAINSKNKKSQYIETIGLETHKKAEETATVDQTHSSGFSGFSGFEPITSNSRNEQYHVPSQMVDYTDTTVPSADQVSHPIQPTNDSFGPIAFVVSLPMLLIYAFDFSFWGSGICMGLAWILYLLFGVASLSEL